MESHVALKPRVYEQVRLIMELFSSIDAKVSDLQQSSGIACLASCDLCCRNPEVEVSIAEMLPTALRLYNEGRASEVYERLISDSPEFCYFLAPGVSLKGSCSNYETRPGLCRLFGFSSVKNKAGSRVFTTCKPIKQIYAENVQKIEQASREDTLELECMSTLQLRLASLDAGLPTKPQPINEALKEAIARVARELDYFEQPSEDRVEPMVN